MSNVNQYDNYVRRVKVSYLINDGVIDTGSTWSSEKINSEIGNKQDTLIPGTNISIDSSNTISAEGYIFDTGATSFAVVGNNTATGANSFAEGRNTVASASSAHAEGTDTVANGASSHAEGSGTLADGASAHAEGVGGYRNVVSLPKCTVNIENRDIAIFSESMIGKLALGNTVRFKKLLSSFTAYANVINISTSGYDVRFDTEIPITATTTFTTVDLVEETGALLSAAHSEGYQTKASGQYSHSEGNLTTASGHFGAHAEGNRTTASGSYSHAEGNGTTASNTASHAEGNGTTASGGDSHAEGNGTTASGSYSHAEGYNTIASGHYSHAEGEGTEASNFWANARGCNTKAMGTASTATGSGSQALGQNSQAEGQQGVAVNQAAHGEGHNTCAYGNSSHAEGSENIAIGNFSHSEGGNYNSIQFYDWENYSHDDTAHTVTVTTITDVDINEIRVIYLTDVADFRRVLPISETIKTQEEVSGVTKYTYVFTINPLFYSEIVNVYPPDTLKTDTAYGGGCGVVTRSNVAVSASSHAEGQATTAIGIASHSEGYGTKTSNNYERASGIYNETHSGLTIDSIGIGTSIYDRKNAIEVMNNGDLYVNGIGDYNGSNITSASTVQEVINNLGETPIVIIDSGITSGMTLISANTLYVLEEGVDNVTLSFIYDSGSTNVQEYHFLINIAPGDTLTIDFDMSYPINWNAGIVPVFDGGTSGKIFEVSIMEHIGVFAEITLPSQS
jgi:hypothetical protein